MKHNFRVNKSNERMLSMSRMIFLYTLTLGVIHGIFTVVATEAMLYLKSHCVDPEGRPPLCVSRRLPYYCHMVSQIIQFSFYLQFYKTKIEKKSREAG